MSPSALTPTEPIAGYTLQQRIGAGGYGEVWRAEAPGGLAKAVKFVYGRLDERRAACELKALNRVKEVRHPFLLSLERIEVVDGQLIIITELAEMSLKDRWLQCTAAGRTGIAREELLIYLRDAADALDYMSQSYSLQHLDVKPENLLIVGGRVKVADFGLVKDIDEATVSLMGGLTPVYAPPEVIEGRPSRHSDQYSLAIVYQEMLTGVLPFPGRTAAQLASQHLHTRPQLGALMPADRPAIARALAKNPAERFPDCRGLVDRLLQSTPAAAPKCSVAPGFAPDIAPGIAPAPLEPQEDAVDASPRGEQPSAAVLSAILASPAGGKTLALDDLPPDVEPSDAARSDVGLLADLPPAMSLTRRPMVITQTRLLPPIDVAPGETRLRPTLVLGIGGVAARTLRRLRQRLADRFGDLTAVPALRMLLLDTDQKNLSQATQGNNRLALGSHEILAMPLRRRQDYRNDSERLLQWMSRRWLYNIPRSLQTGGLRPLGRLALVDHAEALFARLRQTLIAMTAPEALAVSAEKTGVSFSGEAPRVFVVASISGGTGSGMVIDVAYALRKILADLGHSDQGLCGILTHSTGRESTARDLAAVNAYACLSELHHFIVAGYPGDPALKLPPSQHAAGAFNDTYVLNLGDEIDEAACDAATDVVAQYVYLNAVTAGGGFFDACRRSASRRPAGRPSDVAIRSFGLCQLGCTHSSIPATATELLCRTVVDRWRSEAETVVARDAATVSRSEVAKTPAGEPAVGESDVFQDPAAGPLGEFQLSLDQLAGQAREVLREQMGVQAESCYQSAVKQARAAGASPASEEAAEPSPARLLHAINVVLGAAGAENELSYAPAASLPHTLASHLKKLAARQGATICDWILGLVDSSGEGVRGARHATAWIAERLRSLDDEAGTRLVDLKTCLTQFEQILLQGPPQHVPRRSWLRLGRARRVASSLDRQWTEYCQMRLDQLVLGETSTLMRSIRSQVSAVAEKLTGLGLELKLLADEFDVPESWGNRPGDDGQRCDAVGELQSAVAESLWGRIPDLAARLDRQFRGEYFGRRGRREQTGQEEACCEPFAEVLRSAARAAVIEALREIKVTDLFRSPDAPAHAPHARPAYGADGQAQPARRSMQPFLEAAAPKVSADAAEARLLLVCPEGSDAKTVRELAGMNAIEPPSVVFDRDGDLVLCNEVEQASLASVAAHLIDHRSDYAEIAARLHSRVDVNWSSMPTTP